MRSLDNAESAFGLLVGETKKSGNNSYEQFARPKLA